MQLKLHMVMPTDDAIDEASSPVLTRDPNERWEIGNNAINDTVEAMRDDLRDKGMEDGPEMEAIVMAERARMQDELTRNIDETRFVKGTFSLETQLFFRIILQR